MTETRKRFFSALLVLVFLLGSCATSSESKRREYGVLMSAVTFSADKVIGEYGDKIPENFTGDVFMVFIKGRVPDDYYDSIRKHTIELIPKGSYYLLLVRDPCDGTLILFDYSCTTEADGPLLLEPTGYDVKNIEQYDRCR